MSDIKGQTGPATRLIPEMSFICNDTIVSCTVAMAITRQRRSGEYPRVQIWRGNNTDHEHQPGIYYKAGDAFAINSTYCEDIDRAAPLSNTRDIFTCQLNEAFHIKVQPGDILGLELPPGNTDAGVLLFAMVINGPTNYILDQVLSSSIAMLSNETTTDQELPQLVFEFESGIHNLLQH